MNNISYLLEKIEKDRQKNNVQLNLEDIVNNLIVILWDTNDIFLLQNKKKCIFF